MSDDMYISGAHFDNNMPKWATDTTLKRLSLEIRKNHNLDRKQQDKLIQMMGKLSQNVQKGQNDKVINQLKQVNKALIAQTKAINATTAATKASAKNTTTTTTATKPNTPNKNSTVNNTTIHKGDIFDSSLMESIGQRSNKALNSIDANLTKFLKSYTSSMGVSTNPKTDISAKDVFKTHYNVDKDRTNTGDVARPDNDMRDMLRDLLDEKSSRGGNGEKSSIDIEKVLNRLMDEKSSRGGDGEKSSIDIEKVLNRLMDEKSSRGGNGAKHGMRMGGRGAEPDLIFGEATDLIGDMDDKIGALLHFHMTKDKDQITPHLNFEDRIRESIEMVENSTDSMGMLGGAAKLTGKGIGAAGKGLFNLAVAAKLVGGALTVFTVLLKALEMGKDLVWDAQQQARGMIHTGFTLNTGLQSVEDDIRMDGITVRRMVTQAGLVAEQGIKLLENNAVLVNRMGVDGFFGAIKDIGGDANDINSFMNQMKLSREQIGEFTSEYLGSLMKIGDQQRMNEDERTRYTRSFIKNAADFGRATGVGMDAIMKRIHQFRDNDMTRLLSMRFGDSDEGREKMTRVETIVAALGASGIGDTAMKASLDGITSGTNVGIRHTTGGGEMFAGLQLISKGLGEAYDDLIRETSLGNVSEQEYAARMLEMQEIIRNNDSSDANLRSLQSSGNENMMAAANAVTGIMSQDTATLGQIHADESTTAHLDSGLMREQAHAENQMAAAKAAIEESAAMALDNPAGRKTALASYEIAVNATDLQAKAAGFLATIAGYALEFLPKIFGKIASLLDLVGGIFNRVVAFFGGETADERLERGRLERLVEQGGLSGYDAKLALQKKGDTHVERGVSVNRDDSMFTDGFYNKQLTPGEQELKNQMELLLIKFDGASVGEGSANYKALIQQGMKPEEIQAGIDRVAELYETYGERYGKAAKDKLQGRMNPIKNMDIENLAKPVDAPIGESKVVKVAADALADRNKAADQRKEEDLRERTERRDRAEAEKNAEREKRIDKAVDGLDMDKLMKNDGSVDRKVVSDTINSLRSDSSDANSAEMIGILKDLLRTMNRVADAGDKTF